MAKFNEIPEGGAGVNLPLDTLTLQSVTWEDSMYGRQAKLEFIKEGLDKPRTCWHQLQNKEIAAGYPQIQWADNLRQFAGVLDVVGDGKKLLEEITDAAPDVPFNDGAKLEKWTENVLKQVFDLVLGKEMQVVFYKAEKKDGTGTVSSIPKLKDNAWKLPFGKEPVPNPVLYREAPKTDPTPQDAVDLPPVEGEDEAWA